MGRCQTKHLPLYIGAQFTMAFCENLTTIAHTHNNLANQLCMYILYYMVKHIIKLRKY